MSSYFLIVYMCISIIHGVFGRTWAELFDEPKQYRTCCSINIQTSDTCNAEARRYARTFRDIKTSDMAVITKFKEIDPRGIAQRTVP